MYPAILFERFELFVWGMVGVPVTFFGKVKWPPNDRAWKGHGLNHRVEYMDGMGYSDIAKWTPFQKCHVRLCSCWCFRNLVPVEVGSFYHDLHKVLAPSKWWVCLGFLNHQPYQLHFSVESSFFSTQEERIPQVSPGWKLSGYSRVSIWVASLDRWCIGQVHPRCHGMGKEKCFVCLRCVWTWFTRWWFQICFMLNPTWGRFPRWLICFKWVETTN